MQRKTMVSLFSGAMGLDIGLERTGHYRALAAVEFDPAACATIRKNRDAGRTADPNLRVYETDISALAPEHLMADLGIKPGELDVLVGGPPCQSFSTAGRRGTISDVRGVLLWQFLRYVVALRPKFFLMENVRGLMSAAVSHRQIKDRPERGGPPLETDEMPGSVVRLLLSDLSDQAPEYRVDCFEVNAVNYGAPQLRERVLFVGNRFNHLVEFPNPTHGDVTEATRQPGLFDPPEARMLPFNTLGNAIRGLCETDPVIMDFSPRKKGYLAMVKPGGNWRTLPEDVQRESMGKVWHAKGGRSGWWRRLSYDLPSPTIVTMPNHAGTSMCHPEEIRALTLRECALIQEFPPDWEFVGTPQQQYAQVGNAVPVRLGEVAGKLLAAHLEQAEAEGLRIRPGVHEPFRLVYLRSHVRTRQWFKNGKEYVWSDDGDEARYGGAKTERRVRALAVAGQS